MGKALFTQLTSLRVLVPPDAQFIHALTSILDGIGKSATASLARKSKFALDVEVAAGVAAASDAAGDTKSGCVDRVELCTSECVGAFEVGADSADEEYGAASGVAKISFGVDVCFYGSCSADGVFGDKGFVVWAEGGFLEGAAGQVESQTVFRGNVGSDHAEDFGGDVLLERLEARFGGGWIGCGRSRDHGDRQVLGEKDQTRRNGWVDSIGGEYHGHG